MAAPPARTEISDTYPNPSNAVARTGFGKLYDYVTGLLGATGNQAEALVALGVPGGSAYSAPADTGYIRFPSWLGGWIVQWGASTATTNAGNSTTITFPIAFPNSVRTVVAMNGHGSTFTHYPTVNVPGLTTSFGIIWTFTNTGGGIGAGVSTRANWIAFGN